MFALFLIGFVIFFSFGVSNVAAANASSIYVNGSSGNDSWDGQIASWNGTSGPKATIDNATETVTSNGTVYIADGTYNENNIIINRNLTLIGESQENTIIDGNYINTIFNIKNGANVYFINLKISNGDAANNGGAIENNGSLDIENCTITDNYANNGGAIENDGNLDIENSTITNNFANNGGAIENDGNLYLNNSTFLSNSASYISGWSWDWNDLSDDNPIFSGMGGAILDNGDLTIKNSDFDTNTAVYGGAIYNNDTSLFISGSTFTYNFANNGGAIENDGTLVLNNSTFLSNSASYIIGWGWDWYHLNYDPILLDGMGGAICDNGNLTVTNSDFNNNTALDGGAIFDNGTSLFVKGSTFTNNTALAYDSNENPLKITVYNNLTILTTSLKLIYNFYEIIYNPDLIDKAQSILDSVNSLITLSKEYKITTKFEGVGGAIDNYASNPTVTGSIFNNNTAQTGGAIQNFGIGNFNVSNSTFTNNTALEGGAIYDNATLTNTSLIVTNNSFNQNGALDGGGAICYNCGVNQMYGQLDVTENIFNGNIANLGGVVYVNINGNSNSYINFNTIYGTNNYDIYDPNVSNTVDARFNWWGSNHPGADVENNEWQIITSPYMILTVTANPYAPGNPKTIQYGGNTSVTADLLHDSNYLNDNYPTSSFHDPQYRHIPDGIPVTFNILGGGTITPISSRILNGRVTVNYFANGVINTNQLILVNVTSDQIQAGTVQTLINVTKIPTQIYIDPVHNIAGQNVTLSAQVTDNKNNPLKEGNVTFKIGTAPAITTTLNENGIATYNWTIPYTYTSGAFNIIDVSYSGTTIYSSSQRLGGSLTVDPIFTAIANVNGGLYNVNKVVSITSSKPGNIYYTLNGSTPTLTSATYSRPITINSTETLKYFALDLAGNKSPVYTQYYTIDKIPPKVLTTNPKNLAQGISRTTTITLKFSENIKTSTTWSKIYVKDLNTGKIITINKIITGSTLTIKTGTKTANHWYQIYIPAASVKDNAGNNNSIVTFKYKTG